MLIEFIIILTIGVLTCELFLDAFGVHMACEAHEACNFLISASIEFYQLYI